MNRFTTSIAVCFCLISFVCHGQQQTKTWKIEQAVPPLNAPCVQVGVDEYGKPYYFKHTTQNDSEFVLEVSIDRSGAISRLLHGKYAGKPGEAPAVICGMAGDQVKRKTTIQAGCSCDETAMKMVRTNSTPYKMEYCGHIVLLHGPATETTVGEAAWKGTYTYGMPSGNWYRPLTVNEFETRNYSPDGMTFLQTRHRIDEYHDTLPMEEHSYHGWFMDGPYRLFRPDGTVKESGIYKMGVPYSASKHDEEGKWQMYLPLDNLSGQAETQTNIVFNSPQFESGYLLRLDTTLQQLNLGEKAQFEALYYFEVSAEGKCTLVGEQILKKKKVNQGLLEAIKAEVVKQLATAKPCQRNGLRIPAMLQLAIKY